MLWFTAYAALVQGAYGSTDAIVQTLVYSTPLVLGGLAVAFGFKAGLFNIGAQGQFLVGALGAVIVGVALADAPAPIAIIAATVAGIVAGGVWGFIPGFLKAVSGAHEVVSTIMLNYVAVQLLAALVSGPLKVPKSPSPVTYDVGNAAFPIIIGDTGHVGIILAIVAAGLRLVAPLPDHLGLRDPLGRRESRRCPLCRDAAQAADRRDDDVQRRPRRTRRDDRPAGRLALDDLELRDDRRLRLDRRRAARPVQPARRPAGRAPVRQHARRAPA